MASFNGPATDPDDQTVPEGREEGSRQPRSGEEDSRQQRMPAAVEAVLLFGHPPDLVLSTYQRLQSARDTDSQHATSLTGSGDPAMTGNAQPETAVSAAALLEAVEDIIRCQRLSNVSPSGSVEAGRGVAASSAPGLGASRGGAAEGDMVNRGQDGGDRTEERMTPSSQLHRGPQQSSSHRTQDWAPSSTHTQSSLNSQSSMNTQSHTDTHASITEQYPSRNHSFIINADGAASSIDSSHMSASSENPESASLTSSENPESASSVTSSENPETTSSMTSACAVSSAVESSVGSAALATSSPATNFLTASHRTDSEVESPAAETAAARATAATAATTAAFPNTAMDSDPRSRLSPTSRDRSGDRNGEEQEAVREERARERRRQLSRLRALREENRRLKARQTCRQCHQNPVALTLLPCGHFCLCEDCGPSVEECPVCRKTILADVRTFVS